MKKTKELKGLTLSDIHFGSRVTTAEELVEELEVFFDRFSDSSLFTSLDFITIAGDVWDNTLTLSSEVPGIVIPFFFRLFGWASAHSIVIRILEGTPKHDRAQTLTVMKITEHFTDRLDVKYVDQLSIEKHEGLGITILYVPDECRATAQEVQDDTQKLLDENGIDKVDLAVMHGMFKYQLGNIPMGPKVHDERWYLDRVSGRITVGHIHTASQYERILAQGSFGRLSHGQEEAKGAYWMARNVEGNWSHQFLENKLAKSYVTLKLKGDLEESLAQIDKLVRKLRVGSQIQLDVASGHPILNGFNSLAGQFPGYGFTRKREKPEGKKKALEHTLDYKALVLNESTLVPAVVAEVNLVNRLDEIDTARLTQLLQDI